MRNMGKEEKSEIQQRLNSFLIEQNKTIAKFINFRPSIPSININLPKMITHKSVFPVFKSTIIQMPKFTPPKYGSSLYEVPRIVMPRLELPKLKINYERIESITNDNSKYGWTLTREISFRDYLNDDLLNMTIKEKDAYFYEYYSKNNWEYYRDMKGLILETIDEKWIGLINDCFDGFEQDKYQMVIPILFSVIEGESAFIYQTDKVGGKLVTFMKTQVSTEQDKLTKIAIYSLTNCMKRQLFLYHDFHKNRKDIINRNWVLHGRDDPKLWQKVDALRLINVLSTLQLVKEYKDS